MNKNYVNLQRIFSLNLLFSVICCFQIIISCKSQKSDVFVIDPLKFSNDKFTLSTIAGDVSYIPLDNQVPIGIYYAFIFNKNGLFISIKDAGLLHFDNNGKFVKVIAQKGRGPNEYQYGLKFAMDEENKNIYLVDKNTIKVYQLNGRFIRSFSTKDFFNGLPQDIMFFNSSLFIAHYGEGNTFKYNWIITDTLGNILSYKYSNIQSHGFLLRGSTYSIGDKLYYYNWLSDTIFTIYPDFTYKPGYLFAQGNFRWPDNIDLKKGNRNEIKSYFRPIFMFETNHFVFLRYAFRDKVSILMIDKKTKDEYQGFVENYGACIENDFDCGLHFMRNGYSPFSYYTDDHEYIITLINPFELKAHVASEAFKNSTPKYPEKKKELEKLANSLDENDNPVLMLVKLKK